MPRTIPPPEHVRPGVAGIVQDTDPRAERGRQVSEPLPHLRVGIQLPPTLGSSSLAYG